MFGALMIIDMMIFSFMAYNYTYVNLDEVSVIDKTGTNNNSGNFNDTDIELFETSVPDVVDKDDEKHK